MTVLLRLKDSRGARVQSCGTTTEAYPAGSPPGAGRWATTTN